MLRTLAGWSVTSGTMATASLRLWPEISPRVCSRLVGYDGAKGG
jgi:hypothetical protein